MWLIVSNYTVLFSCVQYIFSVEEIPCGFLSSLGHGVFQHLDNIWLCGVLVGCLEHVLFFHSVGNNPNFHIFRWVFQVFSTTNQSSFMKLTTQVNFVSPRVSQLIHFTPFLRHSQAALVADVSGRQTRTRGAMFFRAPGRGSAALGTLCHVLPGPAMPVSRGQIFKRRGDAWSMFFFLNKLFGT